MGYEIFFLPVGEGSKGGDAIALRYGNLHGDRSEQMVIVIDGGYTDDGLAMVEHIKDRFNTDRVDTVVSTHPDQDHVTGLEIILEELEVGQLLMHQPWRHSSALQATRAAAFTTSSLSEKLTKSLKDVSDLEEIANRRNVEIVEPFAGMQTEDGTFRILGPTNTYYETLLTSLVTGTSAIGSVLTSIQSIMSTVTNALIPETLLIETLRNGGVTSHQNNSSVICMITIAGKQLLFTGDAGIPALEQAAELLELEGFLPGTLNFIQVPHHGSRRNVGPDVLDRLLGEKGQTVTHSTAYISAPPSNPNHKHPSKKVVNAFKRRGYEVHATQGVTKRHHKNAPNQDGYSPSTPLPFYEFVEEDSSS